MVAPKHGACSARENFNGNTTFVDSEASPHIAPNRLWPSAFTNTIQISKQIGHNAQVEVRAQGSVYILLKADRGFINYVYEDVHFVSEPR